MNALDEAFELGKKYENASFHESDTQRAEVDAEFQKLKLGSNFPELAAELVSGQLKARDEKIAELEKELEEEKGKKWMNSPEEAPSLLLQETNLEMERLKDRIAEDKEKVDAAEFFGKIWYDRYAQLFVSMELMRQYGIVYTVEDKIWNIYKSWKREVDGYYSEPSEKENEYASVSHTTVLPDGSAFFTASFPLPKNHWIYEEKKEYEYPPMLCRKGTDDPQRDFFAKALTEAGRYALRSATMNGKEDYDPDAVIQNLIVGYLGYWTPDGLSDDQWANPPQYRKNKNDKFNT